MQQTNVQNSTPDHVRAVQLPRVNPTDPCAKLQGTSNRTSVALDQKHGVDAPVEFRRIGHLCILSPHDLSALGHQAKIADVDLYNSALCHNPQLRQ